MARNRMIKPEFWSSESLMRVSRDARLTFIGLWNFCDDYGFCINSSRRIIGDLYPYDEAVTESEIKIWLSELLGVKLIIPIDYSGKRLLFIRGWGEHQTVQHKSKRSHVKIDDLERVIKASLESHEGLISVYLDSHAPKKKEKEKEKEKEESNKKKGKGKEDIRVSEVLDYLNQVTGKRFKVADNLPSRFNQGYTVEDAKKVIDVKFAEWSGTEQAVYIRPATLFSGKFDGYLNQVTAKSKPCPNDAQYQKLIDEGRFL